MTRIIEFVTNSSGEIQVILFLTTVLICWIIENLFGLATGYKKWKHAFLNSKFIAFNVPIQLIFGVCMAIAIQWTTNHHFGILNYLPYAKSNLVLFSASFILFDLGEYAYHVIMHKTRRLWMFHLVHHSDPIVDVSTTVREHPGENAIRTFFTLIWVILSGAALWMLLLRQIIQTFTTLISHMNYRLPPKTNRVIGWVFITPNLHHVHHHYQQPYTDCNYGDVLSIWDRMFGTFSPEPETRIVFGVDTYMAEKEHSQYVSLLKIPFGKYRKSKPDAE